MQLLLTELQPLVVFEFNFFPSIFWHLFYCTEIIISTAERRAVLIEEVRIEISNPIHELLTI